MKSCWKKIVNQKGNEWWQVGKNKENPLYLPEKWIHLKKTTHSTRAYFKNSNWEVHADKRINPDTIAGKFLYFKRESDARKFVKKYMKENC